MPSKIQIVVAMTSKLFSFVFIISFLFSPISTILAEEIKPETDTLPVAKEIENKVITQKVDEIPVAVDAVVEVEVDANKEAEPVINPEPDTQIKDIQNSTNARNLIPEPDPSTGAMTYGFKIDVPLGRNGMQPDLKLQYNSQNTSQNSIFGYGWLIDIPYIQRVNKKGSSTLYTNNYFTSSLSGDLINVSGNAYASKTERGDFLK